MSTFSFQKMLKDLAEQKFIPRYSQEAAYLEQRANAAGEEFNPKSPMVPWVLTPWNPKARRDLTVAGAVQGQTLVGLDVTQPTDILQPRYLVDRLGIPITFQDKNNLNVNTISIPAAGGWQSAEGGVITGADTVFGTTLAKPKTAGAYLKGGFKFMQQCQISNQLIRDQLFGSMSVLLESALLTGTGASGQPQGLKTLPGIGALTGTFDRTKALQMEQTVAGIVGDDSRLAFVTSPATRKTIKEIQLGTSGRYLWNEAGLVDRPGHVSRNCPDDYLFLGDWAGASKIVLWGVGPQIEVDSYSDFQKGVINFRVLMMADIVFNAGAFYKWSLV